MATPRTRRRGGQAVKVVVTGPFAAGKTTLIRTISEITVLSTERGVTDSTRKRKAETTVAMDFGRITIDRDLVLYLFGTPGQDRFDFMWEILGEGMIGYLLLIDADRDDSVEQAAAIHGAFRKMARVPYVVALNRASPDDHALVETVRTRLEIPGDVAILACDATDKESVKNVLLALLYAVLEEVESAVRARLNRVTIEWPPRRDPVAARRHCSQPGRHRRCFPSWWFISFSTTCPSTSRADSRLGRSSAIGQVARRTHTGGPPPLIASGRPSLPDGRESRPACSSRQERSA